MAGNGVGQIKQALSSVTKALSSSPQLVPGVKKVITSVGRLDGAGEVRLSPRVLSSTLGSVGPAMNSLSAAKEHRRVSESNHSSANRNMSSVSSNSSSSSSSSSGSDGVGYEPLRVVALEGGAAVGKSTLCAALASLGYRVRYEGFVALCSAYPQYAPGSPLLTLKWGNGLVQAVETAQADHVSSPLKGNVLFLDRSLLTPWVYSLRENGESSAGWALEAAESLARAVDIRVVLLDAQREVVLDRLRGRVSGANEAEGDIRRQLGETKPEFLASIHDRYRGLLTTHPHLFAGVHDTSAGLSTVLTDLLHSLALPTPSQPLPLLLNPVESRAAVVNAESQMYR